MCANGCGPAYFPEKYRRKLSRFHRDACNQHDLDYEKGGNEWHRLKADYLFAARMLDNWHPAALLIAPLFFLFVRLGGWGSFNYDS